MNKSAPVVGYRLWLYTRWLHKKTGRVVILVGECRLEATNMPAYLYVHEDEPDDLPWARDKDKFHDGRFVSCAWLADQGASA